MTAHLFEPQARRRLRPSRALSRNSGGRDPSLGTAWREPVAPVMFRHGLELFRVARDRGDNLVEFGRAVRHKVISAALARVRVSRNCSKRIRAITRRRSSAACASDIYTRPLQHTRRLLSQNSLLCTTITIVRRTLATSTLFGFSGMSDTALVCQRVLTATPQVVAERAGLRLIVLKWSCGASALPHPYTPASNGTSNS